jgi:nicotinamide-nucleotide amidase
VNDLEALAKTVLERCRERGIRLAVAESCTGGLVAAALTDWPGSSDIVERGFVTYSNQAKTDLLGVPAALIETFGAVSEEVARAMAEGALAHAPVDATLAITGIAGPGGGTADKPVGTVHLAVAVRGSGVLHQVGRFPGDRQAVRHAAALGALTLLMRGLPNGSRPATGAAL